jgi:hypothetical protein
MADQPRRPGSDGTDTAAGAVPAVARPRWKAALVIILVAAVLVLMIVLHVTGAIGAGTHG